MVEPEVTVSIRRQCGILRMHRALQPARVAVSGVGPQWEPHARVGACAHHWRPASHAPRRFQPPVRRRRPLLNCPADPQYICSRPTPAWPPRGLVFL